MEEINLLTQRSKNTINLQNQIKILDSDEKFSNIETQNLQTNFQKSNSPIYKHIETNQSLLENLSILNQIKVIDIKDDSKINEVQPKKQTKKSFQRYYLKTSQPDPPSALVGLLEQQYKYSGDILFKSLNDMTHQLTFKLKQFQEKGDIIIKEIDDNPLECNIGMLVVEKLSQQLKQQKKWDGYGGAAGLSQWLIFEAINITKKSPEWIQNFVENVTVEQMKQILTIHYGEDQHHLEMEKKVIPESDDIELEQVLFDGEVNDNFNDDNQSLFQETKNQRKNDKNVIQHYQLDSFTHKLNNYPINSNIYKKCNSKQANKAHSRNKNIIPIKSQKHPDLAKCHSNQLCEINKMSILQDQLSTMPLPLPFGNYNKQQRELNQKYASNPNFQQRNMLVEPKEHVIQDYKGKVQQGSIRVIATKEALDKWHAISLSIPIDKYIKQKKLYKQYSKISDSQGLINHRKNKQIESKKNSVNVNDSDQEQQESNKLKNNMQPTLQLNRETYQDFNHFIQMEKKNQKPQVVTRKELKVTAFSKFQNKQSEVILRTGGYSSHLSAQHKKNKSNELKKDDNISASQNEKNQSGHLSTRRSAETKKDKVENSQQQTNLSDIKIHQAKDYKIPKKQQPSDLGVFKSQLIAKLFNKQQKLQKQKYVSQNNILHNNCNDTEPFKKLINKTDIPIFVQQKLEIEKLLEENQQINKQLEQKIKYNSSTAIKRPDKDNSALKLQNFRIIKQNPKQIPIKLQNQQLFDILNQTQSSNNIINLKQKSLSYKKQLSQQNIISNSRFKEITLTNDNSSTKNTSRPYNYKIQSEENLIVKLSNQKQYAKHPLIYQSQKEYSFNKTGAILTRRDQNNIVIQQNTRANTSKIRQMNQQNNPMNINNNDYNFQESTNKSFEFGKTDKNLDQNLNNNLLQNNQANKVQQNFNQTSLQIKKTKYLLKNKFFIQDSQLKNTFADNTFDSQSDLDQQQNYSTQIKLEDSMDLSSYKQKNLKMNLNINISKNADCPSFSNRQIQQSQNTHSNLNQKLSVQVVDEQFYDNIIHEVLEFGQPMQNTHYYNIFEKNRLENQQFKIQNGGYRTSQNEELFYTINNQVKGKSVVTNSQKNLLSFCQTQYFQDFKLDTKQNMCKSYVKVNKYRKQSNQNNLKKDSEKVQKHKHHRRQSSIGQLVDLPFNEQLKMKVIIDELQADNIQDTESPFIVFDIDQQVNYVELQCKDLKPKENQINKKYDFNSEQFWFLKAYNHFKSKNNDELKSAIDCFVQTIKSNPLNIYAIHNLACVYETQQRFQLAIKWFDIAIKLDPDNKEFLDTYYSLALAYFKSGNPQEAIVILDKAILMLENIDITQRAHYDKYYFRYLRALCNRALMKFKESEKDYCDIIKIFELEEGKQISSIIISMILMPLEQNRKKLQKLLERFKAIIDKYDIPKNRKILSNYYVEIAEKLQIYIGKNKHPVWIDKHVWTVHKILKKLSFFKRFNIKRIKEIMDNMKLKLIQKKNILFFEKNKVYVLITGSILMQCHQNKPECPITLAKFQPGSIMNFMQDDSKIFNSIETWFLAQVETEVAVFDKKYFQKIWDEDIMTYDLMFKKNIVNSYQIFKSLSEIIMMSLVSEYIQQRKFKKGDVVLGQSKFAPSCPLHQEFLQMQAQLSNDNTKQKVVYNKKGVPEKVSLFKSFANYANQINQREKAQSQLKQNEITLNETIQNSQENQSDQDSSEQNRSQLNILQKSNESSLNFRDQQNQSNLQSKSQLVDQFQSIDDIFNSDIFKQSNEGIYIITRGRCQINHKADQYKACYLQGGEFFGESEILKVIGYDYFGDIIAESEDVECMFISQDDLFKIPLYELIEMKNFAEKRQSIKLLAYQYSKKYNLNINEYLSYYN